ncbi:MAG: hypothetical protein KC910_10000, partial [Candidatus Eremiobacteraeota bacterium]|nr:hypothetical protein [Candidatus Eremiobacteraeota bacterium]
MRLLAIFIALTAIGLAQPAIDLSGDDWVRQLEGLYGITVTPALRSHLENALMESLGTEVRQRCFTARSLLDRDWPATASRDLALGISLNRNGLSAEALPYLRRASHDPWTPPQYQQWLRSEWADCELAVGDREVGRLELQRLYYEDPVDQTIWWLIRKWFPEEPLGSWPYRA